MSEEKDLSFEETIKKLDSIIKSLENSSVDDLEDMIMKYEEGTDLLQKCYKYLEDAEMRVETISQNLNREKKENNES
ncbi:MAG TPA: exodeoxyribonuclease VII small subunit [Candidatus Cloacimonadota bacterium]|jgi:exodeoxyribonuclease VII small subunit|nr:exodeoxyribonuclease VII small subunit [Candidatus Cloacimonadales bacterium]HPY96961.1 exodeoxyribonuclease VII small subunit [Candidatus Cloacimonadota bacterium]HQB41517.1 exodeoxyribonuclease VII small subunit [Candidatus Cloacimonadota bacterium]